MSRSSRKHNSRTHSTARRLTRREPRKRITASERSVLARVRIRRAHPSDKTQVLRFCRRTWGNYGDFMHVVWDEWVSDKRGYFAVAALGQRPIGTAKLTVLKPGEVWFEGLRVDPEFRGFGLAQKLTDFLLKKAAVMRVGSVRYATGGSNLTSQHIGKSWGFALLRRYTIMEASPDGRRKAPIMLVSTPSAALRIIGTTGWGKAAVTSGTAGSTCTAGRTDAALLTTILRSSFFVSSMRGLASEGWTFHQIDEDFVRRALGRRELYVVLASRGRTAGGDKNTRAAAGLLVATAQRRRGRLLVWTLADLRADCLPLMLGAARRIASDLDLKKVRLVIPYSRAFTIPARSAGFHQEYHGMSCVVMELGRAIGRKR